LESINTLNIEVMIFFGRLAAVVATVAFQAGGVETMGAAEVGGFRCREERPRRNFSGSHDKKEKEGQSKGDKEDKGAMQRATVCWAM
jgi:hypothetical protein